MRVAVLLDSPPTARFHRATLAAIEHAASAAGRAVRATAVTTDAPDLRATVDAADGVVVGPGSPYRDELAVWDVIGTARARGLPLVGT